MTMTDDARGAALRELAHEVFGRCANLGPDLAREMESSGWEQLPDDRAERLFTRILLAVRGYRDDLPEPEREAMVGEVRAIVAETMAAREVHRDAVRTTIELGGDAYDEAAPSTLLYSAHGLNPRPVRPIPVFNGESIAMVEGFARVSDLRPWVGNPRLELHMEAFRREYQREASPDEIVQILAGKLTLPGMSTQRDPFELDELARSIASKGVQQPPVVDQDGTPRDGNRRLAACLYIQGNDEYMAEEKLRASEVRVWQAPPGTTDDQFDAIVASLNFEPDHKLVWPTYLKARQVVRYYDELVDNEPTDPNPKRNAELKREAAKKFAVKTQAVTRYIKMVRWAEDFAAHQVEVKNQPESNVEFRTIDIFEWFYELDAGKGDEKLTAKLDADPVLKDLVYDLMYRDKLLTSGAQVRSLYKLVTDDSALECLLTAQDEPNLERAREAVEQAFDEARKARVTRSKINFAEFLRTTIEKLDAVAPSAYHDLDADLLLRFRRAVSGAIGLVDSELESRATQERVMS
jgi:hypothetical protein